MNAETRLTIDLINEENRMNLPKFNLNSFNKEK